MHGESLTPLGDSPLLVGYTRRRPVLVVAEAAVGTTQRVSRGRSERRRRPSLRLSVGDGALPYTSGIDLFFVPLDANGNTLESPAAGQGRRSANPPGGFLLGRSAGIGATAFGFSTPPDYSFLAELQ